MNLSASILGTSTVEQLKKTYASAVFEAGSDKLTRADFARVGCYNYLAARMISKVLKAELPEIKNLRQLFNEVPPSALALPHVGVISLAVLGAAFEARGIGGDTPLENYVRKHARNDSSGEPHITTFYTIKKHEQDERSQERKEKRRRKKQRRDKAHAIRVERFEDQQPGA